MPRSASQNVAILLFSFVFITKTGLAAFDAQHAPHHFFNAQVLDKGEAQVAISGNVKYGILPELEIGTQFALLTLPKPNIWNFALKHRMFETAESKTSFVSHSFYTKSGTTDAIASLYGIVNTREFLHPHSLLSLGLFDGLLIESQSQQSYNAHRLTPSIAWDWVIAKHWAMSLIVVKPIYALEQAQSVDAGELSKQVDFTKQQSEFAYSSATFTYSGDSFNFEFGAISPSTQLDFIMPYINMFWRFHAS